MELTIYEQTNIFLRSFGLGAVLAAVYTVIAVLRTISPPDKRQLFVTDMLFMLLAGLLNFLFALSQTSGMIRAYSVAAQTAAFALLYGTVGRLVRNSSFVICSFIKRLWKRITKPFFVLSGRISIGLQSNTKKLSRREKSLRDFLRKNL